VPFAVSRGGLTGTVEVEWHTIDFDGKRSDIVGLDRKTGVVARISGSFLEFGPEDIQVFEAQGTGALSAGSGAPSLTVAAAAALSVAAAAGLTSSAIGVPDGAGVLFSRGRYTDDLRLRFLRGGGGDVRFIFPVALCDKWDLKGKDKSEAEISAQFTARLDYATTPDTDAMPYIQEIRDA